MMADLLYSVTLLLAMVGCGTAAAASAWLLLVRPAGDRARGPCRIARGSAIGSLVLGWVSAAVHLAFGHRPGTTEGLGAVRFVVVHPSYLAVLVVAAAALVVVARRCGSTAAGVGER